MNKTEGLLALRQHRKGTPSFLLHIEKTTAGMKVAWQTQTNNYPLTYLPGLLPPRDIYNMDIKFRGVSYAPQQLQMFPFSLCPPFQRLPGPRYLLSTYLRIAWSFVYAYCLPFIPFSEDRQADMYIRR